MLASTVRWCTVLVVENRISMTAISRTAPSINKTNRGLNSCDKRSDLQYDQHEEGV